LVCLISEDSLAKTVLSYLIGARFLNQNQRVNVSKMGQVVSGIEDHHRNSRSHKLVVIRAQE
jgi:hypothetical protein